MPFPSALAGISLPVLYFMIQFDSLSVDNPYLVYNGQSVLQFNGPTRSFILDGLKSEYRLPNGTQLDGSSGLQVFYVDNGETVNGDIVFVQSEGSTSGIYMYSITFTSDLPPVVNVTVLLDLTASGLPDTRTVSVLVQSIGKENTTLIC